LALPASRCKASHSRWDSIKKWMTITGIRILTVKR
jgi:hypothetical protein